MKNDLRTLGEKLCRELAQSEQSAEVHPAREARRLGRTPPGRALRAISEHATRLRPELTAMCVDQPLGIRVGRAAGEMFSTLRHLVFDRLIDTERSYRGTLLGLRHGVDLARLLREIALRRGQDGLVQYCDELLVDRVILIEDAEAALAWFADEPGRALQSGLWASEIPTTLRRHFANLGRRTRAFATPAHARTLP